MASVLPRALLIVLPLFVLGGVTADEHRAYKALITSEKYCYGDALSRLIVDGSPSDPIVL
jgi:hypothetical protein